MSSRKAIVIGVGPEAGLGARLAQRFASLGLHVFVAGRTQADLDRVVRSITTNDGTATAIVADATDEAAVTKLFDAAEAAPGGPLDVAIYNAGNNTPGRIVDMDAAYFERAWRVGCFGGFLFGREAIRRMLPNKRGTLLFTGASASMRGRANFGAFNAAKGALRNHGAGDGERIRTGVHSRRPRGDRRADRRRQDHPRLPRVRESAR